ncbi:hypothetical protein SAMN02745150_00286 [Brevinema andersonii]|uniref:Uncharacterized protein n=1 Tax=Brevinema andersonii TaxID=34097 RepID=A0A1I1D467_BREAD|nr:hypothetical protein [Brevinema andersonii]SFB69587.1 hypothetical protein SAMN02745150_00286 [Brevinema andersonii]
MKSIIVLSIAFLATTALFFLYERTIILNPFMDPIAPYLIWGMMVVLAVLWCTRLIQALVKK